MNEAQAYISGDTVLADALGRIEDMQQALGESLARELEHESTIARLLALLASRGEE